MAIIGFMPTQGAGAIGSLDYTPQERKVLAKKWVKFMVFSIMIKKSVVQWNLYLADSFSYVCLV